MVSGASSLLPGRGPSPGTQNQHPHLPLRSGPKQQWVRPWGLFSQRRKPGVSWKQRGLLPPLREAAGERCLPLREELPPCQPAAGPARACSPPPASPPRPEGSAGFPLSAVCKGQLLSPGRGAGPPPPEGPGPAGRCGPAAGASGGAFGQEGERRKVCFWEGAETQAAPQGCAVFTWTAQFSEL